MSEFLPSHLKEDDTVSPERAKEIRQQVGDDVLATVNPLIVIGGREFDSDFVEWRCEGKYIYNPDGSEKIFDCVGAGGVFGLGFAQPDIVEAVVRQAKRGGLFSRAGFVPGQPELAKKLLSMVPDNMTTVSFGNSGTEAMEMAIKLARLATGKRKLIGTHLGYHGMSIGTVSLSGLSVFRDGIAPYLGGTALVEHGNLEALEAKLDEKTAAVVMEPIQWASGCKVVDKGYFKAVSEMCKAKGALLILDEVQTGLGRCGYKFALEHWDVKPDILAVGKVLSGGMVPMSAVIFGENVHRAERQRSLFNNLSFGGNPLACAAAITTINLLEDRYFERARILGDLLGEGFESLAKEFPDLLAGYHGLGLMRCLEFHQPLEGICYAMNLRAEESIIVASMTHIPQFVRISPPFIADDEDITNLIEASRRVLLALRDQAPIERMEKFQRQLGRITTAMTALNGPVEAHT